MTTAPIRTPPGMPIAEPVSHLRDDGRFSMTLVHAGGHLLKLKKSGYEQLEDSQQESDCFNTMRQRLHDIGIEGPSYLCVDATQWDGMSAAAARYTVSKSKQTAVHFAAVAGYGVNPLLRSVSWLFQRLRWNIGVHLFATEDECLQFLRKHEIQNSAAEAPTSPPGPAATQEVGTGRKPESAELPQAKLPATTRLFLNKHLRNAETLEIAGFGQQVIQPPAWVYTSDDNSFRFQAVLVREDTLIATMRGYLAEDTVGILGALWEEILDSIEGLYPYVVHDCLGVSGASLAARREVLSWQERCGTRVPWQVIVGVEDTEVLVSWARAAAPELLANVQLRDTITAAFEEVHKHQSAQREWTENSPLESGSEFASYLPLGGRMVRVLRPPTWSIMAEDGQAESTYFLMGGDTLCLENRGNESDLHTRNRLELMERILAELGDRKLHYIHDDQAVTEVTATSRRLQIAHFRNKADQFTSTTHIGSPTTRRLLTLVEPILAATGFRVRTATSLEHAWLKTHPPAPELADEVSQPAEVSRPPLETLAVEELLSLQTDRLQEYQQLSERLLEGMANIYCEEESQFDESSLSPANPFASLFSALQLLQRDFNEILEERDRRETELAKAQIQAEAANRAKTEFLATISHELRTPLTPILGLIERLEATELDAGQRSSVDGISRAASGLLQQVSDLLDFTTIEAGKLRLNNKACDVSSLLASLGELHRESAERKGLSLSIQGLGTLPPLLEVDAGRFRQIVDNLISNSIKFTDEGSVMIKVSTIPSTLEFATRVRVSVKDTGPGVPERESTDIFKRFRRGREAEDSVRPGVGLGLAIASTLVEHMGGMIGLETQPGKGATFWFELDLPVVDPDVFEAESQLRSGECETLPGGIRLLLVDDNDDIRVFASQILSEAGCLTFTASNGVEALEQLTREPVDLVLMDCKMPVMDGFETTEELRRLDNELSTTPVVALTAYALDEERERCFMVGMNDYLTKPFSRAQLFAKIVKNLPREKRS